MNKWISKEEYEQNLEKIIEIGWHVHNKMIKAPIWNEIRDLAQKSITISMPNWNSSIHIEKTLGNILKQDFPKDLLEIIFIDHASEEPHQWVKRRIKKILSKYPNINLRYFEIKNNFTKNCTYPHNVAIRKAKNEIILLEAVDNIQLSKNYLDIVSRTHSWRDNILLSPAIFNKGYSKNHIVTDTGASINKKHLLEVRGWDERYIGWGGIESDLFRRLTEKCDIKAVTNPNLKIGRLPLPDKYKKFGAGVNQNEPPYIGEVPNDENWGNRKEIKEVKL